MNNNNTNETTVAVINSAPAEAVLNASIGAIEIQTALLSITNQDEYQKAAEFGRNVKKVISDVKDFWKPLKDSAHKTHQNICAREKAMLEPLNYAEKLIKTSMGEYIRVQEMNRKAAQEAAKQAIQAETERIFDEAVKLEEIGDMESSEIALEEALIMNNAVSCAGTVQAVPKADGVSAAKDWEIVSIDSSLVPISVSGVELRPVDTSAVMRLIRQSKGTISIPGIECKEITKINIRK